MNKPTTLVIKEAKSNIIQTVNNAALPPCIMELIVKDVLNELHTLSQKQFQQDELAYMNALAMETTEAGTPQAENEN